MTLQKLSLKDNSVTSTGAGVLLETMEHGCHITDLDLAGNMRIGNEGASLVARSLGNSALPNLIRLSLSNCGIGDDGFIELVSALGQNTSLLHLGLHLGVRLDTPAFSERAFWALARVYQRSTCCNDLTLIGAQVSPLLCPFCWQDCGITQACSVSTLQIVHLLRFHRRLKTRLNALVAGCRKWNVWGTETAFAL
jgi:hypothetical protein